MRRSRMRTCVSDSLERSGFMPRTLRQATTGSSRASERPTESRSRERPAPAADRSGHLVPDRADFDRRCHVGGVTFPGVPGSCSATTKTSRGARPMSGRMFRTSISRHSTAEANTRRRPVARPGRPHETIKVRIELRLAGDRDVTFDVTETRNGPVIIEDGGKICALKWTALDPQNNEFETFFN